MDLICIDLEASGLSQDSYPIEVAWKNSVTGADDNFLIDPASVPEWTFWDEYAEEIHGIEPELLQQEGITAAAACARLNAALAGCRVICDAYEYDLFWLSRLFDSQGESMRFELQGLDTLLDNEQLCRFREISSAKLRRHRALRDVEDLIDQIEAARQPLA